MDLQRCIPNSQLLAAQQVSLLLLLNPGAPKGEKEISPDSGVFKTLDVFATASCHSLMIQLVSSLKKQRGK